MKRLFGRFRELKLHRQFTVVMFLFLVIPVVVLSSVLFENMRSMLVDEKINGARREMQQTQATVEKAVELCNMTTQVFLNNFNLRVFLDELADGKEFSAEYLIDFNRNIIGAFERLVIANPYLYQARVFSSADGGPEMMPILYNGRRMNRLSWARDGWESGKWQFNVTDELFSHTVNAAHIMSLVTDIEDYERGRIGVLDVSVEMEGLFPLLFEENAEIWGCFADGGGTVRFSNGHEFGHYKDEVFTYINTGLPEPQYVTGNVGGRSALVSAVPLKILDGWYIEVSSLEDINSQTSIRRNIFMAAMLLLVIFLAFTVDRLVKAMLRRVYSVFETISGVRDDRFPAAVPDLGGGEIGEMGRQINKMLTRIEQLMKENINRQLLAKNSELRALQNQINAHFIYNVLESIKMMAEVEGQYVLSDTVTSLGKLLRYSMRWESGQVTVAEEIDYIRNYLALMNLRFDYQISLRAEVSERLLKQRIPKLSLQPVVENAVVHGLEEQTEDTGIDIKSFEYGGYFTLEITDYGCGMSGEKLDELTAKISGGAETNGGDGSGIGLKNVRDRIVMAFGPQYGLTLESKPGEYTKVLVKLPVI